VHPSLGDDDPRPQEDFEANECQLTTNDPFSGPAYARLGDWLRCKEKIRELYQAKPLHEVMEIMKRDYNFYAT